MNGASKLIRYAQIPAQLLATEFKLSYNKTTNELVLRSRYKENTMEIGRLGLSTKYSALGKLSKLKKASSGGQREGALKQSKLAALSKEVIKKPVQKQLL